MTIFFDDSSIPQVEAPVGDFFGSAPGLNPYESLPFTVRERWYDDLSFRNAI